MLIIERLAMMMHGDDLAGGKSLSRGTGVGGMKALQGIVATMLPLVLVMPHSSSQIVHPRHRIIAFSLGSKSEATSRSTRPEARHTVLVLHRAVTLHGASRFLTELDLPVIAIEHDGETRGGFHSETGLSPDRAIADYVAGLEQMNAGRPRIFAFRVMGRATRVDVSLALRSLRSSPQLAALRLVRDDLVVAIKPARFGGPPIRTRGNDSSNAAKFDRRMGSAQELNQTPSAHPWAPSRGYVRAFETSSQTHPRQMLHKLVWDAQEAIDTFQDNAYEHNFVLVNRNNDSVGTRPFCVLAAQMDDFWADRSDTGGDVWLTNFPSHAAPYYDTEWSDSCQELDFTVGLYWPKFLEPRVDYSISVAADQGDVSSSTFELAAESLPKDCDHSPWCVNSSGSSYGQSAALLVGETRGIAPGCRYWVIGDSSRSCPRGYWALDEATGPIAHDSSGDGLFDGTYIGAVELGRQGALASDLGTAVGFKSGTYVDIPSDPISSEVHLTAEAWVRTTETPSTEMVAVGRYGSFRLGVLNSKAYARLTTSNSSGSTSDFPLAGTSAINDGKWHHLSLTFDGSVARLFVDATEEANNPYSGWLTPRVDRGIRIGAEPHPTGAPHRFIGDIDEVAIYGYALQQVELEERFARRWNLVPNCQGGTDYAVLLCDANPVGYWRVGELSGTTGADETDVQNGSFREGVALGEPGAIDLDPNTAVHVNGNSESRVEITYEPYGTYNFRQVTAELWARSTYSSSSDRAAISRYGSFRLGILNGRAYARMKTSNEAGSTSDFPLAGTSTINDGQWHHLAITYDGSEARLYVDAVLEASRAYEGWLTHLPSNPGIRIGAGGDSTLPSMRFIGDIDEVALYAHALDQSQLQVKFPRLSRHFPIESTAS